MQASQVRIIILCFHTYVVVHDRKQFVQIDDKQSNRENVIFGVPQGSALGPILFNLYTSDLQDNVNGGDTYRFVCHSEILHD